VSVGLRSSLRSSIGESRDIILRCPAGLRRALWFVGELFVDPSGEPGEGALPGEPFANGGAPAGCPVSMVLVGGVAHLEKGSRRSYLELGSSRLPRRPPDCPPDAGDDFGDDLAEAASLEDLRDRFSTIISALTPSSSAASTLGMP
jgi:hypothetical protein